MDRMKTFGIYALCIILFYIFSNVMINIAVKTSYRPIDVEIEQTQNLKLDTTEVKATYVNGYVEGNIKNVSSNTENTFIKIDLYSKRDVLLGTKYVKVNNLDPNETQDFRMGFEFTDINYCKIQTVNDIPETVTEEQFSSTELRFALLLTKVIFLCYFI